MKKWCFVLFATARVAYCAPFEEPLMNPNATGPLQAELSLTQPQPIDTAEVALPLPSALTLSHKSSFVAVGLSYLFPGLGHLYLGETQAAVGLFGSTLLTASGAFAPNTNESFQTTSLLALSATWSYGLYAAYRDVRKYNGESGYSYKMPSDHLIDLIYAPFDWRVLKKPEVWGGFIGAFALAATTAYFFFPKEAYIKLSASDSESYVPAIAALPIGIGEETLFRGLLQSQLSELLNPWAGITLSSLAFGAAHIPNALVLEKELRWRYYTFSLPLITSLGAYFGWITYKNRSLKESVALHTWYDFVVFAAASMASQSAAIGRPGFAIAIAF